MSLDLVANLVGVAAPGAGAAIQAAKILTQAVENVKVNKFQAEELSRRCTQLALSYEDACKGLEGTEFSSISDDITAVIGKATRRAREWSSLNIIQSLVRQSNIRQGIDTLFRDIDTCAQSFHIATMARLHRTQREMDQIRDRDKDENREMMRSILDQVVMRRGDSAQQPQMSESGSVIQTIQEIMQEGTPEDKEFLRRQLRDILGEVETSPLGQPIPLLVPNRSPTKPRNPHSLAPDPDDELRSRLFSKSNRLSVSGSHSRSPKGKASELKPEEEYMRNLPALPSPVTHARPRNGTDANTSPAISFKNQRRPSDITDFDYNGEEETELVPSTSRAIHESPARQPIELEDETDVIVERISNLGRLGEQLDERLQFGSFGRNRGYTSPTLYVRAPSQRTPETSDSANTPGSSPQSFPSSFGSPSLHPRDRSASSSSSFDLGSSLTDFYGLNLTSVVRRDPRGYTSVGTFAGLVDELLRKTSNGYQKTHEYQETFLTNYRLFGTGPDSLRDVLRLLFRRFTLSESTSDPTFRVEDRVPIRHEVLVVLSMLLKGHYSNAIEVPLLDELLPAIQSMSKSSYFAGQSKDLVITIERLIVACSDQNRFRMSRLSEPSSKPMHLVDFDHTALAFAMKLLEGAAYMRVTPTDCITHLLDPDKPSPLSEARAVNNKLYNWVRRKILSRDNLVDRRNTLQTFISVAHACRADRNFASMATILAAIGSPAISNLRSTRRLLDKEAVKALNNLNATIDPARDHHEYTKLLRGHASKKGEACIPWFVFHVNRLKQIHGRQRGRVVVDSEGRQLINFERYRELSGEITHFLQFQHAHSANYPARQLTFPALSYLEEELKKIRKDEQTSNYIEQLSLERQAQEDRDYNN
ncbi:ras GEF [Schizopora paradoxa]|uniref:Ras GEF n=1 Tax=Schizopora paradoxa TaxID=27342 RepID=A0A0H2RQD9_9AGAM|nr:ras GEF [Schizopora paradoxa]